MAVTCLHVPLCCRDKQTHNTLNTQLGIYPGNYTFQTTNKTTKLPDHLNAGPTQRYTFLLSPLLEHSEAPVIEGNPKSFGGSAIMGAPSISPQYVPMCYTCSACCC